MIFHKSPRLQNRGVGLIDAGKQEPVQYGPEPFNCIFIPQFERLTVYGSRVGHMVHINFFQVYTAHFFPP